MAYNINALFGNSYSNKSNNFASGVYSSLSDYKSIRSGSYKKLVNSYYGKGNDAVKKIASDTNISKAKSSKKATTESRALTNTKADADSFVKSAVKLTTTSDSKSIFKDATAVDDKIYSAVKDYVNSYNSLIEDADKVNNTSVLSKISNMNNQTKVYADSLSQVGITRNNDGTLSVNEEEFKKADISKVKSLFNGSSSAAYQTMNKASMVGSSATVAQSSSLYGMSGEYSNSYQNSSYNWYF